MKHATFSRWLLAGVCAASLVAAVSASAQAQVDTTKSTVTATSKQMNVPVEGKFNKFTAQLDFDPAKPAAGSANLTIDTSSYDLGDDRKKTRGPGTTCVETPNFH